MPRNLDRRVELLVPVEDPKCRDRLIHILETSFNDTAKSRKLTANGLYRRPKITVDSLRSQEALYEEARQTLKAAEQDRRTTFEAHEAR
jgi:polyphosphate kinase